MREDVARRVGRRVGGGLLALRPARLRAARKDCDAGLIRMAQSPRCTVFPMPWTQVPEQLGDIRTVKANFVRS
jgi:hypothetical protein